MMRTQARQLRRRRRGVAMLLVLGVVGIAAVMGYAMLASASLQKQATANAAATIGAQGMAESGVNLAIYYLQSPERWTGYPSTYPQTETYDRDAQYWTGTGGQFVDFGSPAVGSVKVAVVRCDPEVRWRYDIEAVGRAAGSAVERKVSATVWVNAEYKISHAATFTNDVTLPSAARVGQVGQNNGDVYSNGALVIRTGGVVNGKGTRRKNTFSAATPTGGWRSPVPVVPQIVPKNLTEIRDYLTYESPAGTERSATMHAAGTEVGEPCVIKNLGTTASNPEAIHYVAGNATLKKNAKVEGTLIVNGNLLIDGTGAEVRARDGFPALLVTGDVIFTNLTAADLTVEGLTWVGGRVDSLTTAPILNVTGSLMVGGTTPIFPTTLGGKLNLYYDANKTALADFSAIGRTPTSVKILSWQSQ